MEKLSKPLKTRSVDVSGKDFHKIIVGRQQNGQPITLAALLEESVRTGKDATRYREALNGAFEHLSRASKAAAEHYGEEAKQPWPGHAHIVQAMICTAAAYYRKWDDLDNAMPKS